jgi:S1-C subfamily serine protease
VEIARAEKGAAATAAGLRSGDIILSLAGRSVENIPDLQRILGEIPLNEPAQIEVLRRTERLVVPVTPVEAPV